MQIGARLLGSLFCAYTVHDGAIFRFDGMTNRVKPWNVTVQTVQVLDLSGTPMTIQVICPSP